MTGATLSHFRILAKIGEGGMGVVYRAEDEKLRRPVALKVLPPGVVGDEQRRLRFLREARAAAAVSHPSIATIYEVGESDGVVFIAMELVEGKMLSALIGGKPLPIEDALRISIDVAEGLARAHEGHVIHRDLKPDNIVIGTDGRPKILDFGLAKLLRDGDDSGGPGRREPDDAGGSRVSTLSRHLTREGSVFGTPAYMSPEQARGEETDARSDLFSFGSTLYEVVTGRAPFEGRTTTDILSAILRDQPPPASSLNPEVPPELERIIGRCLEKNPADRYRDTRDLVAALRGLERSAGSGAARARPPEKPRSGGRRLGPLVVAGLLAFGVAVFAGLTIGLRYARSFRAGGAGAIGAPRIASLAVLPLANLSRDPGQEYFADGMTEELITDLSKIGALRVISRTSAMRYKAVSKPLPEIGRELGVDAVVEGSVLRAGDRVRITAQLVEAATDRHLWAESYERDLRDVLSLQSEVARAVAQEIRATLTPQEEKRLAGSRQVDPEAYQLYLQGRFQFYKVTAAGFRRSRELFEKAIEKDPGYAQAYAGLADAFGRFPDWGLMPPAEAAPRAKQAALESLRLDDSLAEGHASLGMILLASEHDWVGAEREFHRAIELNPGYWLGHFRYALYLTALGRHDEAQAEMDRARRLDPLSLAALLGASLISCRARRYEAARRTLDTALDLEPDTIAGRELLGTIDAFTGRYEEAIAHFLKGVEASTQVPFNLAHVGWVKALQGKKKEALEIVGRVSGLSRSTYVPASWLALIYAALGDHDRAIDHLERAYREHEMDVVFLKVDPQWDPLRRDPRFQDLLRRVGLPPG